MILVRVRTHHRLTGLVCLITAAAVLLYAGKGVGEETMTNVDFHISVESQRVPFTNPPIFEAGRWLVPLERFAGHLGLKVEYPENSGQAVLCGGVDSELCVPLRLEGAESDVVERAGVRYVEPTRVTAPFGFKTYETETHGIEVYHPSQLAPEFTLPDLTGTQRALSDFRGKKTLLYVWGSW